MGGAIIRLKLDGSIDQSPVDLPDYKFFCFNGKAEYCQVIQGRSVDYITADFFDRSLKHQLFQEPQYLPKADKCPILPSRIKEMWEIADKLAAGMSFIRVDLYYVDGEIYVGELTFFPTSGFGGFKPKEWDKHFGDMLILPSEKKI